MSSFSVSQNASWAVSPRWAVLKNCRTNTTPSKPGVLRKVAQFVQKSAHELILTLWEEDFFFFLQASLLSPECRALHCFVNYEAIKVIVSPRKVLWKQSWTVSEPGLPNLSRCSWGWFGAVGWILAMCPSQRGAGLSLLQGAELQISKHLAGILSFGRKHSLAWGSPKHAPAYRFLRSACSNHFVWLACFWEGSN